RCLPLLARDLARHVLPPPRRRGGSRHPGRPRGRRLRLLLGGPVRDRRRDLGHPLLAVVRVTFLLRSQDWPLQWPFYALAVTAWLYFLGGRASATPGRPAKRWRGAAFYGG